MICSGALDLEELILGLERSNSHAIIAPSLIGTQRFPRLHLVELYAVELELRDLIAFLLRHTATLRTLRLHTVRLRHRSTRGHELGDICVDELSHTQSTSSVEQNLVDSSGIGISGLSYQQTLTGILPVAAIRALGRRRHLVEDDGAWECNVNLLVDLDEKRRAWCDEPKTATAFARRRAG
ncbi:MAG: hypothetical protein M1839_003001 [Geoglossum umbratile]|nr:MAG: hypothetical protein M1839_003001 [Geoglossum umbratile]